MGIRDFFRNFGKDDVRIYGAAEAYQYVAGDPEANQTEMQEWLHEREKTRREERVSDVTAQIVSLLDDLIDEPEIPEAAKSHYKHAIGHLGAAGLAVIDDSDGFPT